jgi:cytochrome P450
VLVTISDGRLVSPAGFDDLLSEEAVNDPVRYYARLRDVNPVVWNDRWSGWIVTGYDEVIGGYKNHEQLSSERFVGPFAESLRTQASTYDQLLTFLSAFFVWKDQPYHTHIRTLVNKAFTPRAVEALRPRVRQLVRELADPLEGRDDVDFFAEFAFTLPVIVIAEFLGVPAEAREDVKAWSEDLGAVIFVNGDDDSRHRKGEEAMRNLVDLLRPIVRARRTDPRDDLLSGMVQAEERGDFLSEDEVIANAVLMVFAGHETTMNLLSNGIVAFDRFPGQWQRLHDDPELARSTVEEVLRYDGPIKAMARFAKEPMVIGEQKIATNDRVLLTMYAANHDPKQFGNPEQFDIARTPNRHAGFGYGIHMCLGAPLARLEAAEAFNYLTERYSGIEVRTPQLRHNPNMVSRSLKGLQVAMHAR